MDKIRILNIQINNLFGELSYDINLPEENQIAIITAPNGRGKTTILNLISFVFEPTNQAFTAIKSIPFDTFRCVLSNGKTIELKRNELETVDKTSRPTKAAALREQNASRIRAVFDTGDFTYSINDGKKMMSTPIVFSQAFIEASRMDPQEYLDDDDEDYYYYINSYRGQRSIAVRYYYIWKLIQNSLHEAGCSIPVNYIKADRIQPVNTTPRRRDYDEFEQVSPLDKACQKIGELITEATDKYYDAVSQAKDKLPKMFLEDEGGDLDDEEFIAGWNNYRRELNQFQDIGLITPTEDFIQGKDVRSVYNSKSEFLSTYLQAFEHTTEPLRSIYERLNLFKTILDERNAITRKKASFSREGVKLTTDDREIKLEKLSSGEKHDFIMFYNLILGSETNGLVLIDEPEISLHIEWQQTYLDKLISICEMNGFQAIIATHSPNIVSSHYDFLVDKGEKDG